MKKLLERLLEAPLTSWLFFGFFFGICPLVAFVVTYVDSNASLGMKIFLSIAAIITTSLYCAADIKLRNLAREKQEKEIKLRTSTEKYLICEKFNVCNTETYESFVVDASNEYVHSIFNKNINLAISCAIMDFMTNKNKIDSLCSIKLFSNYIKQNWNEYKNQEVTVDAFVLSYGTLSMTPFWDYSTYNYDDDIIDSISQDRLENMGYISKYSSNGFNIRFEGPADFNFGEYFRSDQLPVFVKARGMLTLDEDNKFVIHNCQFDIQHYPKYIHSLEEKILIKQRSTNLE